MTFRSWLDGMQIAKALDSVTVRHAQMPFKAIKDQYKKIQAQATEAHHFALLEIKRRVAERILHAALDKKLPVPVCLQYRKQLAELGYTDTFLEFESEIIFCRYLIRVGAKSTALQILKKLRRRSPAGPDLSKEEISKMKSIVRDLIDECRS